MVLVDILDDMLAGIGWTMQEYLKHGEHDYYPPLANGHRLFLHDIRRVAVRCAVAMGEEGDMVVSIQINPHSIQYFPECVIEVAGFTFTSNQSNIVKWCFRVNSFA